MKPQALPSKATLVTLLATSLASALLAIYQWFELLDVRRGGTPICAINSTLNCVTVWNSQVASALHGATGLPVAGLGLVWGATAVALSAWLWLEARRGAVSEVVAGAVKLWALAGGLSVIGFIASSLQLGALCLTCMGTYVIVTAFLLTAILKVPGPVLPSGGTLVGSVVRALTFAAACYVALLYPGSRTPKSTADTLGVAPAAAPAAARPDAAPKMDFDQYFANLPLQDAQFAAYARQVWRTSMTPAVTAHPVRSRLGPADAKVKIVDFTDIQCGHCRQFDLMAAELLQVAPEGSFSLEARHFPLDAECNKNVQRRSNNGISCLGAKIQICLDGSPKFHEIRHTLFERQTQLSTDLIWQIALTSGIPRAELEQCVASPQTQALLDDDLAYAVAYELEGTPLVLVNGRKTEPSPAFLLGMILSGGNADAPLFKGLPPPPELPAHEH